MNNNQTFTRQLRWMITLRWTGIGIALIAAAALQKTGYISSSVAVYVILCFPILFNLLFSWQVRNDRASRHGSVLVQIILD
jgi:hypothetical protein